MRYYDLTLTQGGKVIREWTSYPNGVYDSGAQNVLFDILVSPLDTPSGASTISIEGVSLDDLFEAKQFANVKNPAQVILKGGFKEGYPLNNPKQSGVIMVGQVFQSFGNWVGTDMRLDLVVIPSPYSLRVPGNLVLNWPAGQLLGDVLTTLFKQAFPNLKPEVTISPSLIKNYHEVGVYKTLSAFANAIAEMTSSFTTGKVRIAINADRIIAYDSTYKPTPIPLVFDDMIGQPTWISYNTLQIVLAQRADLSVGSQITMPKDIGSIPGFVQTTVASTSSYAKYQSTFKDTFTVTELRQLGNFRSPNGQAWSTIINATTA